MRARRQRPDGGQNSEDDDDDGGGDDVQVEQDPTKTKKFPPDLGPKLAFLSLLALVLSSLSGVWFSLLQSQPVFVSATLSVFHLGLTLSLGQSFLPKHFSVWGYSALLGVALSCGECFFLLQFLLHRKI